MTSKGKSVSDAAERVEDLRRAAFLRARGIDPNGPFQLDLWPADMRAMPNDYARSALFTVRNKREPRAPMVGTKIFHIEKAVRITYTGIELRADDDELVWQQILHYARDYPLGEPVEFNLHQLLKDMGWSINARNYDKARNSISRLKASEVKVENERIGRGIGISLIQHYEFEGDGERGSRYRIWIHKDLIILFAGNTYTRVAWNGYRDLTPIARRLYDYVASHKQPFPLRLEVFHKACASSCQPGFAWTQMVRKACKELVAAKLVKAAWVEDGAVHFDRGGEAHSSSVKLIGVAG